jgi:hypothetical protein
MRAITRVQGAHSGYPRSSARVPQVSILRPGRLKQLRFSRNHGTAQNHSLAAGLFDLFNG